MKKIPLYISIPFIAIIVCLLLTVPYVLKLDDQITTRFEGKRWELPARIYARPLELYVGKTLSVTDLEKELIQLRYSRKKNPAKQGEYSIQDSRITIYSRAFHFPDELQPATRINLTIQKKTITTLATPGSDEEIVFRLEPLHYASIYPRHNEDRLLIKLADTPILLVKTLLSVEDQHFYSHLGLQPSAITRAAMANLKAGKTVQGGSTLTQQLVKNIFLGREKTLLRKANEAIMSLLLEFHYSKDEILEAYLNEVYLGQDGKRAIHGFAQGSRFYFNRNLSELEPEQFALLVGLVKGASYYNPRNHPDRALSRRNQVLDILTTNQLISAEQIDQLKTRPLGVTRKKPSGITQYPAFLQLVRRQLARDYQDEDLRSEGLSIFTTLDPIIQAQAEKSLSDELGAIERRRGKSHKNTLQGALILASVDQGEVVAVVGNRRPHEAGFNRALDMKRPIGSIIKPAVYLTALARPASYNLLTPLSDTPVSIPISGEKDWQPENYDHLFHGPTPLRQALIDSLNVSTVHLGMSLGLDSVIEMLKKLGVQEEIKPYPSLLLGSVELPPVEVLQMYQTIAAGGYQTPLRTILAVTDQDNTTLQRYPLTVQQTASAGAVFCLTNALEDVTTEGTAKSLKRLLPAGLSVAGKTGTTNNLRDSWFAGFSGEHVAVAWVGRDDNKPTGLTGATGALGVWAATMAGIDTAPLQPQAPATISWYYADTARGTIYNEKCSDKNSELLPFINGGLLPDTVQCDHEADWKQDAKDVERALQDGLKTIFNFLL